MKVSVVICTRNRAGSIIPCLESIATAAQIASLSSIEIVVVDNASDDNTSAVVSDWGSRSSIALAVEYEPRAGITIAKNRGLRRSSGDLIVLTDDDCRLQQDYFVKLLQNDATEKNLSLCGGRVELGNPDDLPLTIKTDTDRRSWTLDAASARRENLGNCLLGCNLFMRREVYETIGPFDERFGVGAIPAGEDTDYIFRAYAQGISINYHPDIVVFHHHGRRHPEQARKLWRGYMIGSGALYSKHLFKSATLCRQVVWDLKSAAREAVAGRNLFLPEFEFSYRDKLFSYMRGSMQFLKTFLVRHGAARP